MNPEERTEVFYNNDNDNGKKKTSRYSFFITLLCCVVAFVLGAVLVMKLSGVTIKELELKTIIKTQFDGEFDPVLAEDYEMTGIVSGLNDKNSFYVPAEDMISLNGDVNGKFGGIGVQIANENDKYVVESVTKGGPASKQGVLQGDIILSVDGVKTEEIPFNEITKHVRGEVGTDVVLGIERDGKQFEVTMTREEIKAESVKTKMIEGNIGYVSINGFDEDTHEELKRALETLESPDSIILDLRNNLGGFLHVCAETVDLFLEKDKTIVKACYKEVEDVLKTKTDAEYKMPMVVLVNGYSASSSEIFASCMQDHKRAKIIGEKTYGKGSIQRTFEFADGSGANITIGHFYSSNGRKIDGEGIMPDIEVKLDNGKDTQLEKAIEVLKKK